MPQVVVYFDPEMAEKVDTAARRERKSRSAWVREAVAHHLDDTAEALPDWWWENLGTWEDERTAKDILRDIDAHVDDREEPPIQ